MLSRSLLEEKEMARVTEEKTGDEKKALQLTKQIDSQPFGPFHKRMLLALGTIWMFDGYEVSLFSIVSLQIKEQFHLSQSEVGLIGSAYLLGCAIGALVFSFFSLRLGRKRLFGITLTIYLVSTLLFSASFCLEWMLLMRFLTGFGIGGEYSAIFSAVDEMIPP